MAFLVEVELVSLMTNHLYDVVVWFVYTFLVLNKLMLRFRYKIGNVSNWCLSGVDLSEVAVWFDLQKV